MDAREYLGRFGLVPSADDLPTIRGLLNEEAEAERSGKERREDLALLCCVQLFAAGQLEDVLRVWAAKQSGFDLGCSIDIQLLCGAGLIKTKQFLAGRTEPAAAAALKRIEECEGTGDFESFTPAGHLDFYRRYFRTGTQ